MPVQTLVPIEIYLNTSYEPDCDFIDGELEERNVGSADHARIQTLLTILFGGKEADWDVLVVTEMRVQVTPTRVRIPDISVVRTGALDENVLTRPPLICIEILSPEDRYSKPGSAPWTTAGWASKISGSLTQRRAPARWLAQPAGSTLCS